MDFSLPTCDLDSEPGRYCQLHIVKFSPTQNAVGFDEVNLKTKKIVGKTKTGLKEYLYSRPVPVVIGLDSFYLIDHHHLVRALWEAAGDDNESELKRKSGRAVVKVVENWQFIKSPKRFWKAMDKKHWVYPYDFNGGGPLNIGTLEAHVKDLRNDIYRSLAWYVRKRFGYFKDPANPIFAEFKWGDFFRARVRVSDELFDPDSGIGLEQLLLEELTQAQRDEIVNYAVALARSSQASGLPGFFIS